MRKIEKVLPEIVVAISVICFGIIIPFISVKAIGQITEPIDIKNAQRGSSYAQEMTIMNTESVKSKMTLSAEGDIDGWVEFFEDLQEEPISEIEMESREKKTVIAKFSIPESVSNGKYAGFISVRTTPGNDEDAQSGNTVSQKIDREVTIEVGGEEVIDFDVSLIPEKYDLVRGEYLKIRVAYSNYGNTMISPQIEVRVKQNDQTIYTAIFPYPENQPTVIPNSTYEIPALEIPTSNLSNGKYIAVFDAYQSSDKENMIEKDFTFSIGMVKAASSENDQSGGKSIWSINRIIMAIVLLSSLILLTKPRKRNDKIKTK